MVPRERFNETHLIAGPPESGKSFKARQLARSIARRAGAYLIAHVVTGTMRGEDTMKARTYPELRANIAARPGALHVYACEDGRQALDAGLLIAHAIAERQGGEHAEATTPVMMLFDEVCEFENMSPSYLDPALKRAVLMRRHLPGTETAQMGFVFCTQTPQMVHPTIWRNCNSITMFKLDTPNVASYLYRTCGVPRELAERALSLELTREEGRPRIEGRHFVTWDRYTSAPVDVDMDDIEDAAGPDEPAPRNATKVDAGAP